jgi:hypothetical protein
MRILPLWLAGIILCPLLAAAQRDTEPDPPPLPRSAERMPLPTEPPLLPPPRPIDPVKIKNDAEELAKLAASIPADVDRVALGLLPKDLREKLKRIEKLSKRLRSELSP